MVTASLPGSLRRGWRSVRPGRLTLGGVSEPTTPVDGLDALVGDWLTLPDLADALGIPFTRVRGLVAERRVVGVRRGERSTYQVPTRFLVPVHLADPANATTPDPDGGLAVLLSLQGTLVVLGDAGFDDRETIEWLFTVSDELGEAPIEALRSGRKSKVRQVAQALA